MGEEDPGQGVIPGGREAGTVPAQNGGGAGRSLSPDGFLRPAERRTPGIIEE